MLKSLWILTCLIIPAGLYTLLPFGKNAVFSQEVAPIVKIEIPIELSNLAILGKQAFDVECASLHGDNAVGNNGITPQLKHKTHEPKHEGNESFYRVVAMAVRAHQWKFSNMPSIEEITWAHVKAIIAYVRELQRHNGIM